MSRYIVLLLGVNEFDVPMVLGHEFDDKPADDAKRDTMVKKAANGGLSVKQFEEVFRPVVQSIQLS